MTDNHTANFSQEVNPDETLLLAFVWSTYSAGVVRDYNWNVTYLPACMAMPSGDESSSLTSGASSVHTVGDARRSVRKVLYVRPGSVNGAAVNEQGDAALFVLREVWALG